MSMSRSRAIRADVDAVEEVAAHHQRATLRVGEVFLKIDADQTRTDIEVDPMAVALVPTRVILWRKPPVLALAAVPGTKLGHPGEPSTASFAAWVAAGAAVRALHDAPLHSWPSQNLIGLAPRLDDECEWLVANDVVPAEVVTRNHRLAKTRTTALDTGFQPRRSAGRPRLRRRRRSHRRHLLVRRRPGRRVVRPRHPHPWTPRRRHRRERHRRRPHPGMVVACNA